MKKTRPRKRPNLAPPVDKSEFIELLNTLGRNKTATKLNVGKATVYQWAKAFGLKSKKTIVWYESEEDNKG